MCPDAVASGPRRRQPQRRHQQDAQPQIGSVLLDDTRMAHRFAVSADACSQRYHASDARALSVDRSPSSVASSSRRRRRRVRCVTAVVSGGFGPRALGHEESWLSICAVRQRLWERADGQLTQVARECVEWFHARTGTDVRELGIQLRLKGGDQIRVFLELGVIAGTCCDTHHYGQP